MKIIKLCYCFFLSTAAVVFLAGSAEDDGIRSHMNPIACKLRCYRQDKRVWATVIFTNSTDQIISVFSEGLLKVKNQEGAGFRIISGGTNVQYLGMLVKRPPARIDEFYPMKPKETITANVELSSYFDLTKPGEYTIRYTCITEILPLTHTNLLKIESNTASIRL